MVTTPPSYGEHRVDRTFHACYERAIARNTQAQEEWHRHKHFDAREKVKIRSYSQEAELCDRNLLQFMTHLIYTYLQLITRL